MKFILLLSLYTISLGAASQRFNTFFSINLVKISYGTIQQRSYSFSIN